MGRSYEAGIIFVKSLLDFEIKYIFRRKHRANMSSGDAVGGIAELMAKTSVEEAVGLLSFACRGLKLDNESDGRMTE